VASWETSHPFRLASLVARRLQRELGAPERRQINVATARALADERGDLHRWQTTDAPKHNGIVRLVRPGSFTPPPKVTSAIVRINVFDKPTEGIDDPNAFFIVVRAGFSAPRKQLRNSLANGLNIPGDTAEALLTIAGIDPKRRAETLSLAEWASLYKARAGR